MIEIDTTRVAVILLFALTFMAIGWLAPVVYASYVPGDLVIEDHDFTAEDVHPSEGQHHICFDRTVHHPSSGTVFTELYLLSNDNGSYRTEVESETMQRYFQGGRNKVVTPLELPGNLESGAYRYLLVVRLNMANGRVTRDLTFHSKPFMVSEEVEDSPTHESALASC